MIEIINDASLNVEEKQKKVKNKTIVFELPSNWVKNYNREMDRVVTKNSNGCITAFVVIILIIIFISLL